MTTNNDVNTQATTYIESANEKDTVDLIIMLDHKATITSILFYVKSLIAFIIALITWLCLRNSALLIVVITLCLVFYFFITSYQKLWQLKMGCINFMLKNGYDLEAILNIKKNPRIIKEDPKFLDLVLSEMSNKKQ